MSECKHSFNLNEGKFCRYCGINFDDLMRNIDVSNLEKERDELQAQVAVLRVALEKYIDLMEYSKMAAQYSTRSLDDKMQFSIKRDEIAGRMARALDATPVEAVERVQKLVEALEEVCEEFHDVETDLCTSIQRMYEKAQKAISEWRKVNV